MLRSLRPPDASNPLIRPGVIFAVWNAVWLAAMSHYLLLVTLGDVPLRWERLGWNLVIFNLWALATPLIARLVRRFPVAGREAVPHGLVHLAGALGVSLFIDLIFYTAVAAVLHAFDYRRRYQERELRAAQLEGQLAQAQVQALRMQLNPHFLFNTLHAISSLMDDDVRRSRRMLVDLSDLLRLSLDSVGQQEVPLEQELAFLDRYLQIEKVRFGDRLTVVMDVDERALDAFVPNLILQPLVENALKHAVAPFAGPGTITIRAARDDAPPGAGNDVLRIEVQDDGPGLAMPEHGDGAPAANAYRGGLGLRNTRERLERLYGASHRLDLRSRPGHGLTVRLLIPFHDAPTFASA